MKETRKPRKKLKSKVDLLKPLDLKLIGSENDPCFGKLHELRNEVCRRCGDSEICSIICAQGIAVKRTSLESNQSFKDLEEAELIELTKTVRIKLKKALAEDSTGKVERLALTIAKKLGIKKLKVENLIKHIGRTNKKFKLSKKETTITYESL